jgi:DNA replication factor GINS
MNLDELQSAQSRERQASGLQHLRSSFYADVGTFIQQLQDERAHAVEAADDPFSSPDIRQLTDDIETAKQTVEALYERRVGKVVKMASISAAGMPVDDDGLTDEERALFDTLVARIEANREEVLSVLDGNAPSVSCEIDDGPTEPATDTTPEPAPDPTPEAPPDLPSEGATSAGADAASFMGEGPSEPASDPTPEAPPDTPPNVPPDTPPERDSVPVHETSGSGAAAEPEPEPEPETPASARESEPAVSRTTVRITRDIGEIFGTDQRTYHLAAEDVVTLPEDNAEPLIQRDAAEKIQ